MSSVPMMGSGNLAGLSLLGCNAESRFQEQPPSETCSNPQAHVEEFAAVYDSSVLNDPSARQDGASHCDALRDRLDDRTGEHPDASTAKNGCSDADPSQVDGTIQRRNSSLMHSDANPNGTLVENGNGSQSEEIVKLHRIREVREQQGLSVRSIARRLGMDVKSYRAMEDPCRNLSLSELHAVQIALDVPFVDLLEERHGLARPVQERAKLVRVMKSAVAIREAKSNPRVQRLAQMLCEQLSDLMPELADVSGWPQFGARRGQSALGKALREPIDTSQLGLSE